MVGCIVTGHGTFAEGMLGAFEMIAGRQEGLLAVPFHEEEAAGYPQAIRDAIESMAGSADGVLVFCDLMGGTPFNQAMLAAAEVPGVEVVAGTNLPMMLETISSRDFAEGAAALAEIATEAGCLGVAHPANLADSLDANVDADDGEGI